VRTAGTRSPEPRDGPGWIRLVWSRIELALTVFCCQKSGYRNRILPLPTPHRQPEAHPRTTAPKMTAEPVWIQLLPLGHYDIQYILYWYIAETLPPALEAELVTDPGAPYKPPPAYPAGLALRDRLAMEPEGYEPVRHEGTGVDEEELGYTSRLVGVEEACGLLGRGTVSADVVMRGWKGIQDRFALEDAVMAESPEGVA
jgi:hypothetical protein